MESIEYVKSFGVATVELLPIHTFTNDSHLLERVEITVPARGSGGSW